MSSYRQQKCLEREIRRLQADLLDVKQQRKKKCKAKSSLRQDKWLENIQQFPEEFGIEDVDALESEDRDIAWALAEEDPQIPGWIMLAQYSAGNYGHRQGGHFLAVNLLRQEVILDRYESHQGFCDTCDYGARESHDDIEEALGGGRPLARVSCDTMAHRAKHFIDPSMTVRQLRQDDHDFAPLACLYTVYSWYAKTNNMRLSLSSYRSSWRCKYFFPKRYRAIVKLQAMIRGWLYRHKVLYNPQSEIGRRFLLRGWESMKAESGSSLS